MVKLVNTTDLKSVANKLPGSSPGFRTKLCNEEEKKFIHNIYMSNMSDWRLYPIELMLPYKHEQLESISHYSAEFANIVSCEDACIENRWFTLILKEPDESNRTNDVS